MSITTILTSLNNLEKLHRSLLRLAYDKTALIKNGDMEGLDQMLKDEQAHLAAIMQMDGQRQRAVAQYLTDQGRSVPAESDRRRLARTSHRKRTRKALRRRGTVSCMRFMT